MRYWSRYGTQLLQQKADHEEEQLEPERETTPPLTKPTQRRNRRGGGEPISPQARARLEHSLGADLSGVRLHHDPAATEALGARAFSDGEHIMLDSAADRTDTGLLAHEAAHITQAGKRGATEGVSQPGGATEHEAQAAQQAVETGETLHISEGSPVPALQRQKKPGAQSEVGMMAQREAVRMMLTVQFQQQGGQGAFKLTAEVRSALQRLIPALDDSALSEVWSPEPKSAAEAFQRLTNSGYLPMVSQAAEPEVKPPEPPPKAKPVPEPGKSKPELKFIGLTGLGLHLIINPRAPAPLHAVIRQELAGQGISMTYDQVQNLLAGHEQGVEQIDRILKAIAPGLGKDQRQKLAGTIADALISASIKGQMRREMPTALEHNIELEQQLQQSLGIPSKTSGGMVDLLKMVPVGISVTFHF